MRTVVHGMNLARQRRKIEALVTAESPEGQQRYVTHLVALFDASVAAGTPQPASQFIPMFAEEFDL